MTTARAYVWSLVLHGVLALGLWKINLGVLHARHESEQREAAKTYEATYQRTAATTYADRLKRMRELLDRLDSAERSAERERLEPSAPAPEPEPIPAPENQTKDESSPAKPDSDLAELWHESRKHHEAVRERYLEQRAEELARLTKREPTAARQDVLQEAADPLGGKSMAPAEMAEVSNDITLLHDAAQRLMNRLVEQNRRQGQGVSLNTDVLREAHELGQSIGGSGDDHRSRSIVDWTPLFVSRGPRINSELDTAEDARRAQAAKIDGLRHEVHRSRKDIRFTRRLGGAATTSATWVAPDAWYMIGPFPNPWRSAIETAYPPEIHVDRDAVYEGRDGRPIAWQHVRTPRISVMPPNMSDYGIYYAFTEVHCAEAMDCWLAIGSDDYSKLWVNNLLVWAGSKNEKMWDPAEGFRRVRLEQGMNRLLLRLENGINACEFSVLIRLE